MRRLPREAWIAAALAVALVLWLFGPRIADPFDLTWIDGDTVTGLFGWTLYRADPHHWFPVVSDRYAWPQAMPLAMFDVMPLVALAVKALVPASLGPVQYFGPLFVVGVGLQALFAFALLREATGKGGAPAERVALLLGTLFLATAPILLVRFQLSHVSIAHHWPLIAALWLAARSTRVGPRRTVAGYAALLFVTAAMNPYLMVMGLMIYAGFALKCLVERALTWPLALLLPLPALTGYGALLLSGFMDPFGGALVHGEGYGFFSANLYTLFNPMREQLGSAFLPELQLATSGQYEGYGYLGLGGLLLVGGGLVFARLRGEHGAGLFGPLVVVAFAAFLLSLSLRVTFGLYSFDLAVPQWLFDVVAAFRSSGRFVWVTIYILLLVAIAALIRQLPARRAAALLGLATLVQAIDLAAPLAQMRERFAAIEGSRRFADPAFAGLGRAHDLLIVQPAWQCQDWNRGTPDYPFETFIPISNLVADNGLRTNSFYGGRSPVAQIAFHCRDWPAAMAREPARARTAWLLAPAGFRRHGARIAESHLCDFAEGFFLCRGDRGMAGLTPRAQAAALSLADRP